jgi:hypothetical protein
MQDTEPDQIKQAPWVVFDEDRDAIMHEERMAAVLITKTDEGNLKAYVKDVEDRNPPDPEAVAMLVQAVEIANL